MSQVSEAAELLPPPLRRLLYSLVGVAVAALIVAPVASLVEVAVHPGEYLMQTIRFYVGAIFFTAFPDGRLLSH